MKVKNVLMIAAVLLAMLVVPVAAEVADKSTPLSVLASSDIEYEFDIPVSLDLNSVKDLSAGITVTTISPGSQIKLSVGSDDNEFKLIHTYDSKYNLSYTVTSNGEEVSSGDVILFADADTTESQSVNLLFTADLDNLPVAGNYKDTLTFTAKVVPPTVVTTVAELKSALSSAKESGEPIRISAGGQDIGSLTYVTYPDNSVISDAVVSANSYGGNAQGTVTFIGCEFNNPSGAYSVHFDAGSADSEVIFEDCTLAGWCSFGTAVKKVTLINCKIEGNGIYGMARFYQDTELIGCTIDCSNSPGTDVYADGISALGATVTLTDCTIIDADFEVADNAKIVVDDNVKADSVNGEDDYLLIPNGEW